MGTIQESLQENQVPADASPARTRQSLPAKGSCWYCEKPLDSVRRFCGKECADAFDEEKEFTADAIANPPR
ncbi:MAG: hypothetical protein V4631_17250 [Pseudomonadota bacterium]